MYTDPTSMAIRALAFLKINTEKNKPRTEVERMTNRQQSEEIMGRSWEKTKIVHGDKDQTREHSTLPLCFIFIGTVAELGTTYYWLMNITICWSWSWNKRLSGQVTLANVLSCRCWFGSRWWGCSWREGEEDRREHRSWNSSTVHSLLLLGEGGG